MITTTNEKLVGIINDLIEINNDRVNGYEKAANEIRTVDIDLQTTFHKMADDSRRYAAELTDRVRQLGGEPSHGTTNSGKIYRVWMDVKATFSGKDRQTALENCEFGEDAAQKAYKAALSTDEEIDSDTRQLIMRQQSSLKEAHDLIKNWRDAGRNK